MTRMAKLVEAQLSGPVTDLVEADEDLLAATGRGVYIVREGMVAGCHEIAAEFLVTGRVFTLALSPLLPGSQPQGCMMILSQSGPPEWNHRRNLHLLSRRVPGGSLDCGQIEADEWAVSCEGTTWATLQGNSVQLHEITEREIRPLRSHEVFMPVCLEWLPDALWVKTTSIGATHYRLFRMPTLKLLEEGDFPHPPIRFTPECHDETAPVNCQNPTIAQPIFATSPWTGNTPPPRIVVQDGRTVATLEEPALGIVASGDRALAWAPHQQGLECLWIGLSNASVLHRFLLPEATSACARIAGQRLLVGDDRGRVSVWVEEG